MASSNPEGNSSTTPRAWRRGFRLSRQIAPLELPVGSSQGVSLESLNALHTKFDRFLNDEKRRRPEVAPSLSTVLNFSRSEAHHLIQVDPAIRPQLMSRAAIIKAITYSHHNSITDPEALATTAREQSDMFADIAVVNWLDISLSLQGSVHQFTPYDEIVHDALVIQGLALQLREAEAQPTSNN